MKAFSEEQFWIQMSWWSQFEKSTSVGPNGEMCYSVKQVVVLLIKYDQWLKQRPCKQLTQQLTSLCNIIVYFRNIVRNRPSWWGKVCIQWPKSYAVQLNRNGYEYVYEYLETWWLGYQHSALFQLSNFLIKIWKFGNFKSLIEQKCFPGFL